MAVADVGIEVTVIRDTWLETHVQDPVFVQVGSIVIGLVIQLMITTHDQHIQRCHGLADK
ncbi:MAG TPA: hypothetical protein DCG67_07515 [Pseudomonas sp.]|nr:hypothetical protein [Pseudomonas sp.]